MGEYSSEVLALTRYCYCQYCVAAGREARESLFVERRVYKKTERGLTSEYSSEVLAFEKVPCAPK